VIHIGTKSKNDAVVYEMAQSGWFRVNSDGRIETCYQWRACKEYYDRDWFICDRADGKGYRYISFRHNRIKAHRLAYVLYTNQLLYGMEINHLDGNRLNNLRENLELCDARRNSQHAYDIGLNKSKGVNNHNAKLNPDKVRAMRRLRSEGFMYSEIGVQFGVTTAAARFVCTRHTWKDVE